MPRVEIVRSEDNFRQCDSGVNWLRDEKRDVPEAVARPGVLNRRRSIFY